MALSLDEFCSRLAHLRLDRSWRVNPYKPLLVAALLNVIHSGKQQSASPQLRARFRVLRLLSPTYFPQERTATTERALEEHLEHHWNELQ